MLHYKARHTAHSTQIHKARTRVNVEKEHNIKDPAELSKKRERERERRKRRRVSFEGQMVQGINLSSLISLSRVPG